MGEKIWWQWVTNPDKPWAKLWTAKYANNRPQEDLIRFTPTDKGSLMWNAAKQHYQLIQWHSFWEVRNGKTTRFWTDAWNQMPKLNSILFPDPAPIRQEQQQEKVQQYWLQEEEHGFRQWKRGNQLIHNTDLQDVE